MKNSLKVVLSVMFVLSATAAYAAPDATIQSDDQAINSACSTDAQTASCGSEVVGKGLLKCLHAYKKATPSFKLSASCKAAMKQRHSDKEAGK
jgi:hypothetical protein